ncbi:MAG: glycosyltransferase family 2 protein [Flavobacteriales bacterium]|nr:glycosyltransferase family 2 protein [Bacteroidota bacterium]MCB9240031.1 glycosyltransferase family 2 protein [Flavobacteriales bacterium]
MISVVIPVYNEAENIPVLFDRLKAVLEKLNVPFELIFVNDGSADNSEEVITQLSRKNSEVKYINFSRNFGHQIAVSAGLDYAHGDKVVIIDADGQDPPELIEKLYLKSLEGYEVVYAQRIRRQGESMLKRATARWFYRLMKRITQIPIPVDTGDFRIIDRKVVDQLNNMPERHKFLRGQIPWVGFRQTSVEYNREERLSGETGYSYRKMIRLALDGITSFSNWPLRLATLSGFLFAFVGFLLILYTLYARFFTTDYEPGWASQMITIIFLGGIQLIGIGIIGEYISRMNDNIRNRPLYIVKDSNIKE